MSNLIVTGGTPLLGSVRIGGAKNASFKLMIAALLGDKESRLLNFSHISDVQTVSEIINYLGGSAKQAGERALFINPQGLKKWQLHNNDGQQGRFSTLFIPPLLHRFGKAIVPLPGGDKIGPRPLERHIMGLETMGAKFELKDNIIHASCDRLVGTNYRFAKNTHTGTETMILAAVRAQGKTILENAALEPEIDDLIEFLNAMGARIRRRAFRIIEIEGVDQLGGAIHQLLPDRNEAVSYACAALGTKGDVVIENARHDHLTAFLEKVDECGGGYEVGRYGVRFYWKGQLRACDVTTEIEPGFMTDWQPLWATMITQAKGTSQLHETVMLSRFQYVPDLIAMGAKIKSYRPKVDHPEKIYNFNMEDDRPDLDHAITITGPTPLKPGNFVVKDLRHGATLVLAAMIAPGQSTITQAQHIFRGYEALDKRLRNLGANITKREGKS